MGKAPVLGDYMHYLIYTSNSPIRLAELYYLLFTGEEIEA